LWKPELWLEAKPVFGRRTPLVGGSAGVFQRKQSFNISLHNVHKKLKFRWDTEAVSSLSKNLRRVKDSPAIILASGLAGLAGAAFPTAQGWVLDQSVTVMGMQISAQSLGFFTVSRLLFVPVLLTTILGGVAMKQGYATRAVGVLASVTAMGTLLGWYFQKAAIDQFSIVGVGPALGLFLLLVSGLGGLAGGLLLAAWPPETEL
jgi:hypothetical protein